MSFVAEAAKRAVAVEGRIGTLVLTQTADNLEPNIREPEMRHALAQVAETRPAPLYYGIEVPTPITPAMLPMLTIEPRSCLSSHCFFMVGHTARLIM